MDAVVKTLSIKHMQQTVEKPMPVIRPSREEAEAAVRTLIAWAGDDPSREGLLDTPKRVVKAYDEFFQGYQSNGTDVLDKVFGDLHPQTWAQGSCNDYLFLSCLLESS